jgi:hypothetical protein
MNHVLMLLSVCISPEVLYLVVLLLLDLSFVVSHVIYRSIHVKHIYLSVSESLDSGLTDILTIYKGGSSLRRKQATHLSPLFLSTFFPSSVDTLAASRQGSSTSSSFGMVSNMG